MNSFFSTLEAFLTSAKAKSVEVLHKAADVGETWVAWIRAQADGLSMDDGPDTDQKLAMLQQQLIECGNEAAAYASGPATFGADPKKIDPASLMLIITAITEMIKFIIERRRPKPPTP